MLGSFKNVKEKVSHSLVAVEVLKADNIMGTAYERQNHSVLSVHALTCHG